jgi:hypothetical protein
MPSRAFPRLRDFKAWNGFHDLLIKISSDVIAALESEPPEIRPPIGRPYRATPEVASSNDH